MQSITRKEFIDAIEAGIAASPFMADASAARLREVGRTAKTIGTNYDYGCPVVRARLVPRDYGEQTGSGPDWINAFVGAYDHALPRIPLFGKVRIV